MGFIERIFPARNGPKQSGDLKVDKFEIDLIIKQAEDILNQYASGFVILRMIEENLSKTQGASQAVADLGKFICVYDDMERMLDKITSDIPEDQKMTSITYLAKYIDTGMVPEAWSKAMRLLSPSVWLMTADYYIRSLPHVALGETFIQRSKGHGNEIEQSKARAALQQLRAKLAEALALENPSVPETQELLREISDSLHTYEQIFKSLGSSSVSGKSIEHSEHLLLEDRIKGRLPEEKGKELHARVETLKAEVSRAVANMPPMYKEETAPLSRPFKTIQQPPILRSVRTSDESPRAKLMEPVLSKMVKPVWGKQNQILPQLNNLKTQIETLSKIMSPIEACTHQDEEVILELERKAAKLIAGAS